MSSGTVFIEDLELQACIGVDERERKLPQRIVLNCEVDLDISQAVDTLNIEAGIRYDTLAQVYRNRIESREWVLVEELLENICKLTFEKFAPAIQVRIRIQKFIVPGTSSVGVKITRNRPE